MLLSMPSHVAPEFLYDIFKCLSKNELEKCRLVNTHWSRAILKHEDLLAVRVLKLLNLNDYVPVYEANKDGKRLSLNTAISDLTRVKNCIFDVVAISETRLRFISNILLAQEMLLPKLETICSKLGQPLRAISFLFDMECLDLLPQFASYIQFSDVEFRGPNNFLAFISRHPKELDGLKVHLSEIYGYESEIKEHLLEVATGKKLPNSKMITIKFWSDYAVRQLCPSFIKAFIESKTIKINNFAREIHFSQLTYAQELTFKNVVQSTFDLIRELPQFSDLSDRKLRRSSTEIPPTSLETFEFGVSTTGL